MRSGRSRENVSVKAKASPKPLPGDKEFENYLALTEYEVLQDPYRGLQSRQQSLETGISITTPWNACVWGTLTPEKNEHLDEVAVVRHVGHCACPSMKAWTRKLHESNKKRGKGRKRAKLSSPSQLDDFYAVGIRPTDKSYRCQCDFNPLCLASAGGVINDILVERSKDTVEETNGGTSKSAPGSEEPGSMQMGTKIHRKPLHENLKGDNVDNSSRLSATSVLELVDDNTNGKNENDDVFTFMEIDPNTKRNAIGLKPLCQNSRNVEGDPGHVFTMELPNIDEDKIHYSQPTKTRIRLLRKSFTLEGSRIERYISACLRASDYEFNHRENQNVDKYLSTIAAWERTLRFVSPARQSKVDNLSALLNLSIPPGIENLGATCYLNTQLQCLAQNPVFLNGIFSWRPGNSTHSMNAVISKMQLLLAKMVVGGDCKLSTLDFSNALGLQHNEQQDPNEFARLLFERMEESFQQCDNEGDLKNLLRRIFQGTTTYQTICMTCGQSSERSENFMDLNLPIVRQEKTKGNGREMKIKDYFGGKMVDTDVQHCLNDYLCAEVLDGDNQYFCSKCSSKQDANRLLKLTALPPVLNVQLSRYVFDLSQYVKKKLSDKVLLPTTLSVPKRDGSEVCYKLCAVMRHQGTSAYAGHYIAEAMDWVTGQWFEFNDEVVKHLPAGPSNSYDSPGTNEMSEVQVAPIGSKDAYNMYYVDGKYLKENAIQEIVRRESRFTRDPIGSTSDQQDILSKIAQQRTDKYSTLYDMCHKDTLLADRLRRREIGIRKYMFRDSSSLAVVSVEPLIWVDADTLRKFLRLDDGLDERIRSEGPILCHKPLLCKHTKLHPVTSRRGKILHRSTFNAYVSLLKAEQSRFREESKLCGDCNPVCDVVISLSKNLICDQCSKSYSSLLATRLKLLKDIKELYDCLDPSLDNRDLQFYSEGEDFDCSGDAFVFAVSKRMVTRYRNSFKGLIHKFSKLNDETAGSKLASKEDSYLEGLDRLDLSLFQCEYDSDLTNASSKRTANVTITELDMYFNSEIICEHKKCNEMNDRRNVRFVSWGVWQRLKAVFPEAIELKRARVLKGAHFEDHGCATCREEKTRTEETISDLKKWAKDTSEDRELMRLLKENDVNCFQTDPSASYRLVHRKDLSHWRSVVKKVSEARQLCFKKSQELLKHLSSRIFPKHRNDMFQCNQFLDGNFSTSLVPLVCQERKQVIHDHIFQSLDSNCDKEEGTRALAIWVTVLPDPTYRSFVASLAKLLQMLRPSYLNQHNVERACQSSGDQGHAVFSNYERAADAYHPTIQSIEKEQGSEDCSAFTVVLDGASKFYRVSPPVCHVEQSADRMLPFLAVDYEFQEACINHITANNIPTTKSKRSAVCVDGTNPQEPILVESDVECAPTLPKQYKLRVFNLADTGSIGEAINCLENRSTVLAVEEEKGLFGFVRRSTRKKKSQYPLGCLINEMETKVDTHLNVAALKLLLFERCQVSITGRKLTLAVFWKGNHQGQLDIRSEWIEKPVSDLVKDIQAQSKEEFRSETLYDPSTELYVFHQRDNTGSSQGLDESVMDSLLQTAIYHKTEGTKTSNGKNRKRKQSAERGFQGTLLHSGPSVQKTNSDSSDDGQRISKPMDAALRKDRATNIPSVEGLAALEKPASCLSESDDDIPKASPFASRQTTKVKLAENSNDDKHDDFHHDIVYVESTQEFPIDTKDPDKRIDFIVEGPSNNCILHDSVVSQVLSILGESADQSTCWDAVEWAIKTHPDERNQESLVATVVNKVLESYD
ncbi:unnamed protein product [Cylindrotheca closterium]|uniref:ubiquitinyl hydrolase 1 n=1 Tax=Cylindrotheca closterium TaxID=2856 RepID=A0AAD2PV13_9STRA|nr:unnamed protein product [Cylindrotheca closterium]